MHWIAPTERDTASGSLEQRLWEAADQFRANSGLTAAQYSALPEGAAIGQALNDALADIERHNPQLAGVLPRSYQLFTSSLSKELLKKISELPVTLVDDAFGDLLQPRLLSGQVALDEAEEASTA